MIQAFQGYFKEDGRFVADNLEVKIPANKRVIVNVLDDEIIDIKAMQAYDDKDVEKRLLMLQAITGIISSDIDIDAIKAERIAKRGLIE